MKNEDVGQIIRWGNKGNICKILCLGGWLLGKQNKDWVGRGKIKKKGKNQIGLKIHLETHREKI